MIVYNKYIARNLPIELIRLGLKNSLIEGFLTPGIRLVKNFKYKDIVWTDNINNEGKSNANVARRAKKGQIIKLAKKVNIDNATGKLDGST
jgi:hypothetical protein